MSETRRLENQPEPVDEMGLAHMQDMRERAEAMFALFEDTPVIDASDKPRGHRARHAPDEG